MEAAPIQKYLAGLPGWEDAAISDVELIGQGWESKIYGFSVALPGTTLDLVLRMYTGADGADKALTESGGMPRLRAMGYPVPQVYVYELDPTPLGLPFIVMERVYGNTLWREMGRQPKRRADYEAAFVDLLIELHQLDQRPFLAGATADTSQHLIERDLALWREITGSIPVTGFVDGLGWFERRAPDLTPCPPSVVHNDFHPGNILLAESRDLLVVDWTGLGVADPRSDLAWTLMLMEFEEGSEARRRVETRYGASLPTGDLDYFMAGAYAKRLYSLVVSLTHGPETLGMHPDATAEMRRHLAQTGPMYDEFRRITGLRLAGYEELAART